MISLVCCLKNVTKRVLKTSLNLKIKEMSILPGTLVLLFVLCKVCGDCYSKNEIKHRDIDVTFSISPNPCSITIATIAEKQVVVSFHNIKNDCHTKGSTQIFDGPPADGVVIFSDCLRYDVSFASKRNSLTLKPNPDKPLKPFDIELHAIVSKEVLRSPFGIIKSDRFHNYIDGEGNSLATPNNLNKTYTISSKFHVTMQVNFTEFRLDCSGSGDFLMIYPAKIPTKLCLDTSEPGVNLPDPISIVNQEISLELHTDAEKTKTGFTANYRVCEEITTGSSVPVSFRLPLFEFTNGGSCVYSIQRRERMEILLFSLNVISDRNCYDVVKLFSDGIDVTTQLLTNCTVSKSALVTTSNLTILLKSVKDTESVLGFYKVETLLPASTTTTSTNKIPHTTRAVLASTTSKRDTCTQHDKEGANAAVVVLTIVFVVAVLVIVGLVFRIYRRKWGGCISWFENFLSEDNKMSATFTDQTK